MVNNHIPIYPKSKKEKNYRSDKILLPAQTSDTQQPVKSRRTRSDKCHDIKFPVTLEEKVRLKIACKQSDFFYKKKKGLNVKITQTRFNTLLLRYALKNLSIVKWDRQYSDSPTYMHTKPLESEYDEIGGIYGLANVYGLSERKTVYCLVISALEWIESDKRDENYEIHKNKHEELLRLIR